MFQTCNFSPLCLNGAPLIMLSWVFGVSLGLSACSTLTRSPAVSAKAVVAVSALPPLPAKTSLLVPPNSKTVLPEPSTGSSAINSVTTTTTGTTTAIADLPEAAAKRFLAYHEQLRTLSNTELAQETTRVNALVQANSAAAAPASVLELALALAQQSRNNPADTARAIALLDPLSRSSLPELAPWQPLARLLMSRLSDQRWLQEQLERQGAQLRDVQRIQQQTYEKLEALKAIERSLNAKPAAGMPGAKGR
jgi:hypothetical protein